MSGGFNIETYQIGKQDEIKSGINQVPQEILDRIQKLEDSQMNIADEYYCDFSKAEYIDAYKSTVINTGSGIIPRQYKDTWFDPFNNDDNVDWDKSKNISFYTNAIKLDTPTTRYGEFYTMPIKLKSYIGFKFNANVKIPVTENLEEQQELKSGTLWYAKGIDNYGRLWMFRCDTYKYELSPVYLTIYNNDMTIYKEQTIAAANFFGAQTVVSGYGYSPIHNSATVIFSEENLCIIGFQMINAMKNGVDPDAIVSNSNEISHQKNIIVFVDEYGSSAVKYSYINTISLYNYYVNVNQNAYNGCIQVCEPCKLSIQKNRIFFITPSDFRWFGQYNYDTNRCGRVILYPSTGILDDVNVAITYSQGYSYYYELYNTHYMAWSARYSTKAFKRSNTTYFIMTDYVAYNVMMPIGRMFMAEVKLNDNNNICDVDNKLVLSGTLTYGPYGFGGANGFYYSEKYNYLYVFSNAFNSNVINITRFEVDWANKTSTTLPIINPMIKSIGISGTTFWGAPSTSWTSNDFRNHVNEKLKVYEDKDKLCLLYGSQNSINGYQQMNYMSIDFDMGVIQVETQIHVSDSLPENNVVNADMVVLEDKNLIMYSQGNRDDFNDATAEPNSHLFTTVASSVSSKLTWYYATDTDVTWKIINLGESKTFNAPANDIRIKAVLESNARYDTSPSISGIYIESWDNGKKESRQSEYYSNQISTMQNEGKAVLTADYDLNDGTIDWYVSYDGGQSFSKISLDEEFVYTHVEAPDFRIRAVLSVTDNAKKLPIIRSYTLKSNHVVLHSDLEEIQINLMKTNFKIDTLSKASRNGLFKMFIDVFSDENGIDKTNSDYKFYPLDGAVGGNYLVTVPQIIESNTVTVLLATNEVLDDSEENSHINYFASLDGGITYIPIYPNIKAQLSNTNATSNNLTVKAVFYDNAKLSALGTAWD